MRPGAFVKQAIERAYALFSNAIAKKGKIRLKYKKLNLKMYLNLHIAGLIADAQSK